MPSQLVKLALIDEAPYINSTAGSGGVPLETDLDIEVFSVFQEGAQDASRQVVSIEPNVINIENGIEFIESKTYAIDVVGLFDQSRRTKIKNWSKNRTPLYVVGYGLDGNILYGYGAITATVGTGTNMSFRFRMQNEAKGGYDASTTLHSSGFSYSPNGKAYWKWTARPSNSTLVPLWFNGNDPAGIEQGTDSPNNPSPNSTPTLDETPTSSPQDFSGGLWNVQPATGNVWSWFWMYFPFEGVNLNLTFDATSVEEANPAVSTANHRCFLRSYTDYYGYNDWIRLPSSAHDSGIFEDDGTQTASIITPTGTTVVMGGIGTIYNGRVSWGAPRLTIGEVKPFTEFDT